MNKLIYLGALAIATLAATPSFAQQGMNITVDQGSINMFGKNYLNMKGSAFLYNNWAKGSVTLTNGVVYDAMNLLYDQIKDEVIFVTNEGERKAFMFQVYEFRLQAPGDKSGTERVFRNNFPTVEGSTASAFYEVLSDGNTKLLKRITKAVVDERPDGSIVKEKQIKESVWYYIAASDKLTRINKNKKSILSALQDKAPQVEQYIKDKGLNLKEDGDLSELLAYYDTLK